MALQAMGAAVIGSDTDTEHSIKLPLTTPLPGPKVIVMQRVWTNFAQWPDMLNYLRRNRWLVLFDVDDSPEFIRKRLYPQLTKEEYQGQRCAPLLLSHAVQTSTRALSKHLFDNGWTAPTGVLDNSVLFMGPWIAEPKRDGAPVRIMYGGTPRSSSFSAILPALKAIEEKHNVEWSFLGPPPFVAELAGALGAKHVNRLPIADYDTYLKTLDLHDIALAPLDRTQGHEFKSDVKFIEAASRGCAVVASPTVYGHSISHGKTGLIADTTEDWQNCIDWLISDPAHLKAVKGHARAYVTQHRMMMPNANKQIMWYQDMAKNYDALDQELVRRAEKVGLQLPALGEL